jgi:hypothetical protein
MLDAFGFVLGEVESNQIAFFWIFLSAFPFSLPMYLLLCPEFQQFQFSDGAPFR